MTERGLRYAFDLQTSGRGEAVVMLPGSFATPSAWRGIRDALTGAYRIHSTSLPGYGSTPEFRTDSAPEMGPMIEFVGQVCDAVGKPAHLVGHSWGAKLALAAVLEGRITPLSLLCFEANPMHARPCGKPSPWSPDVHRLVQEFERRITAKDPEAAATIIDFYSRPGTFRAMPEPFRAFCKSTVGTNLRDWKSAAAFTPKFDDFSAVDLPVTLVWGSETASPVFEVNERLAEYIPGATKVVVEGADHFLISTHPADCARILDAHVARARA